jgi:streptogrisin C
MRRLLATLTVLAACLFGVPALAHAAPAPIGGGSTLFTAGGASRCTAAFAATGGGFGHLVAGRGCAGATSLYSGANVLVGPVVAATEAYTVVKVTNTAAWTLVPWIDTGAGKLTITGSRATPVGGSVCLIDPRAGTHCGTVTALNQTVSYPGGVVTGLTRTNVCLEPGGTPVAFVTGSQAQGVPFGGSGSCSSGGTSFFTPVNRILASYGLTLFTG